MKKRILAIDIVGTHIKATIINELGKIVEPYQMLDTPKPANPATVIGLLKHWQLISATINLLLLVFPAM